ncbi:peptidoglycan DD-metalloendopeptidase family protein [Marinoscillum furvescens]|uniref:Murein DD-endopeptidase MepM/ murein hydrolase activator NlpD n=1 Tax=Marinoscillum furvescens DSM 4134 TaxID=1122208 RepID=A0A3D9L2J6_MARFU|nr:peptidoglycan DD-metalloendopeptidase family protein [Marinoscillum furvescens]RED98938.1 murein DD-endopeptidase MepM/ murein hydrolase activator NlpD [Marinoscillum furvescens DSM 4134]
MKIKGIIVVLAVAVLAVAYFFNPLSPKKEIKLVTAEDTLSLTLPEPQLLYGIAIDSFDVFEGKVKWSQNLSEILSTFDISNEAIYAVANASKGVFDVRKLKAGYPYTVVHERNENKTARQLVFEPDATEYVVFNLVDSIYVKRVKREIISEEKTIATTITSSVYEAIVAEGASPLLVSKLVDIFAWQVDFFRIQKGDEIKVIFEEKRVGDEVVGIGKIKGAYFKHWKKEYYAVNYDQGKKVDYFDENGNSLRKTFLRAPLDFTRISSRYSPKRFHPVLKRYKAHLGTDYAAPTGTEIRTVGDGVVLEARYGKYNGNFVKIKHNSNYTTQYLHMSKIAKGIRPGVEVKQGQAIGYVGSTGLANGPHLCFRFWKNGRQVDALEVELPPSEPIDAEHMKDYLHTKNVIVNKLRKIRKKGEKSVLAQIPVH